MAMALSMETSEILEPFQYKENDRELTKAKQQAWLQEINDVLSSNYLSRR